MIIIEDSVYIPGSQVLQLCLIEQLSGLGIFKDFLRQVRVEEHRVIATDYHVVVVFSEFMDVRQELDHLAISRLYVARRAYFDRNVRIDHLLDLILGQVAAVAKAIWLEIDHLLSFLLLLLGLSAV